MPRHAQNRATERRHNVPFSDEELSAVAHGMRTAAQRFRECEQQVRAVPGHERMADQFALQSTQCEAIANRIEDLPD